jgi:hypothetical protein
MCLTTLCRPHAPRFDRLLVGPERHRVEEMIDDLLNEESSLRADALRHASAPT